MDMVKVWFQLRGYIANEKTSYGRNQLLEVMNEFERQAIEEKEKTVHLIGEGVIDKENFIKDTLCMYKKGGGEVNEG
jgi:hypothetical protein